MTTTRGVRKVSENILAENRAIIVTEKDQNQYKWSEIPDGSKFIDTITGIESVKLRDVLVTTDGLVVIGQGKIIGGLVFEPDGVTPIYKPDGVTQYMASEVEYVPETTWVPANVKNDGTLCIAKDAMVIREVFTIVNPDLGDGNFSYKNVYGQLRQKPLTSDGYVFELEQGTYQQRRNHLDVIIDDCLFRNAVSGGVIELTPSRFILTDQPLAAGQEIAARYIRVMRIGNPYPRIFMDTDEPEAAEIGDLWIDFDDNINTTLTASIDSFILSDEVLNPAYA